MPQISVPYRSSAYLIRQKNRGTITTSGYWIIVASQEHVKIGVARRFALEEHGKLSSLTRIHPGDRIIYDSPKVVFGGGEQLHAFTALGEVADDEIMQVEMSPDFRPFRKR
jgi:hypothetical protein